MNFFEEFQELRKILCVCPCCGEMARVSDMHLKVKGPVVKTWLDKFEKKELALETKEENFEQKEDKLREAAREKGRKEAEKILKKAIHPIFKNLKLDPFDVKPILNPVDFVVFNGMNKKEAISDILFLSKHCNNHVLCTLRDQVKETVSKKRYDWQVARIDEKGNIVFE